MLPLSDAARDQAASLYAEFRQRGELIGEVDLLIAGIARANGIDIVTHNTSHFRRVQGLHVEGWSE